MTELDTELGPLAVELIEEYGKEVSYTVTSPGVYDPATGAAAPAGAPFTIKAIVEDYSLQGSGQGFASGLIEVGDKKLTVAAQSENMAGKEPTTSDTIIVDGVTYTVQNVKKVYSGELVALYEIQGRK